MAPDVGSLGSRLTALPVKDEQVSLTVFGDQLSKQVRREFFHHDHNEGTYSI